jgi:alpha-soluble NSF attachment protein
VTWYTDEGIPATANRARVKAGQIAAVTGDYYKAVGIFVAAAEASLATGPTGRFMVKTHLFKAGVCQLATGVGLLYTAILGLPEY